MRTLLSCLVLSCLVLSCRAAWRTVSSRLNAAPRFGVRTAVAWRLPTALLLLLGKTEIRTPTLQRPKPPHGSGQTLCLGRIVS
jgi:hypothetical protein